MQYVVGDVHGSFKEMVDLIRVVEEQDSEAKFIFLGDFIDRGSQVWETLQWTMENITQNGKYQTVRGNHEEMIIQWYDEEWLPWWKKGGFKSHIPMPRTKYDFSTLMTEKNYLTPDKLGSIVEFFRSFPLQKDIKIDISDKKTITYRIAHAWAVSEENISQEDKEYSNLWLRNCDGYIENQENDTIIIHGHTPTIASEYFLTDDTAPGLIGYRKNAINLDGGCTYGNEMSHYPCMLGAICLETLDEIYPYTVRERFYQINQDKEKDEIEKIIFEYADKYLKTQNRYRLELLKKFAN